MVSSYRNALHHWPEAGVLDRICTRRMSGFDKRAGKVVAKSDLHVVLADQALSHA